MQTHRSPWFETCNSQRAPMSWFGLTLKTLPSAAPSRLSSISGRTAAFISSLNNMASSGVQAQLAREPPMALRLNISRKAETARPASAPAPQPQGDSEQLLKACAVVCDSCFHSPSTLSFLHSRALLPTVDHLPLTAPHHQQDAPDRHRNLTLSLPKDSTAVPSRRHTRP